MISVWRPARWTRAVHEQERRIVSLARDRARMQAILGSMVEGVLVVDESGRLQLVNEAARRMAASRMPSAVRMWRRCAIRASSSTSAVC